MELVQRHVDVYGLDYERLGDVARHIVAAIEAQRSKRLTKKRVISLLTEAVDTGRLNLADLEQRVRDEILKARNIGG